MFQAVNLSLVPQFGPDTQTHLDKAGVPHLRKKGVCPQVLLLDDFCCKLNEKIQVPVN